MGLIQRVIESSGIASVSLTLLQTVTQNVKPGKSLYLEFPFGHPFGDVGDKAIQREILTAMLEEAGTDREPGTITPLSIPWTANNLRESLVGGVGV